MLTDKQLDELARRIERYDKARKKKGNGCWSEYEAMVRYLVFHRLALLNAARREPQQ